MRRPQGIFSDLTCPLCDYQRAHGHPRPKVRWDRKELDSHLERWHQMLQQRWRNKTIITALLEGDSRTWQK